MEQRKLTEQEAKAVLFATMRTMFYKGLQVGFLLGLTVGWIAGGLVMLGLGS